MGHSFGQAMANGKSHGAIGHGGHFTNAHMSNQSNPHKSNPHSMGSDAGHTMSNSHGGSVPMGC